MTKQADRPESSAPTIMPPWINGSVFDAMTRMSEASARACQTWQQETVRFATARFESDNVLARRLMTCGTWTEACRLQQDWVCAMMQDYLDQTTRMAEFASTLGAQLMATVPAAVGSTGSGRQKQAAA